jgi:hypothetical protein
MFSVLIKLVLLIMINVKIVNLEHALLTDLTNVKTKLVLINPILALLESPVLIVK